MSSEVQGLETGYSTLKHKLTATHHCNYRINIHVPVKTAMIAQVEPDPDQIRAITNSPRIGSVLCFVLAAHPTLKREREKKPLTECHTPALSYASSYPTHRYTPSSRRVRRLGLGKTGMPSIACQESEGRCIQCSVRSLSRTVGTLLADR